jgi:hypothetical protein
VEYWKLCSKYQYVFAITFGGLSLLEKKFVTQVVIDEID